MEIDARAEEVRRSEGEHSRIGGAQPVADPGLTDSSWQSVSVCVAPVMLVFQPLKVLQFNVAVELGESTSTPKPKLSATSGAVRPI